MGKKQERTVIHLELEGRHYYYGNIKALCDSHSKDEIGIGYGYLRNYGLSADRPYTGKKCIIRKGTIVTSPRSTSVSERNTELLQKSGTGRYIGYIPDISAQQVYDADFRTRSFVPEINHPVCCVGEHVQTEFFHSKQAENIAMFTLLRKPFALSFTEFTDIGIMHGHFSPVNLICRRPPEPFMIASSLLGRMFSQLCCLVIYSQAHISIFGLPEI